MLKFSIKDMVETKATGITDQVNTREGSVRKGLKISRLIKDLSREEKIKLSGKVESRLRQILSKANGVLESLTTESKDFVDRQRERLGTYLRDIPEAEIESSYRGGLDVFLKQQYRVIMRTSPSEIPKLRDPAYLKTAIVSYTVDFFNILRVAESMGIYPSSALEIAKKAHRHNPDTLIKLSKQFPEFENSFIAYAAFDYPTDPEEFLRKIQESKQNLQAQFPKVDRWIIVRAAVHNPSNPKGYIERMLNTK